MFVVWLVVFKDFLFSFYLINKAFNQNIFFFKRKKEEKKRKELYTKI